MRKKSNEPDYESVVPIPFADERLGQYCCYCGDLRGKNETTKDHVPSIGLFYDDPPKLLPTVRVCAECNRSHSQAETYAYCVLSVALSGSSRPVAQRSPVARRILESDKRLRREMSANFGTDTNGNHSIKVDTDLFSKFLVKQARGHVFLECSEFMLSAPIRKFWAPYSSASSDQIEKYFLRSSNVYPEIGSRGFVRAISGGHQLDQFEMDDDMFIVLKHGKYRFRVILSDGEIIVQSVIHEYLLTEIAW